MKQMNRWGHAERLEWSSCGRWLATSEASMGHVVWLWDVPGSCLGSCLVLQSRLRRAAWHPSQPCLLLLTHSASVFLWTPQAGAFPPTVTAGAQCLPHPLLLLMECTNPSASQIAARPG